LPFLDLVFKCLTSEDD